MSIQLQLLPDDVDSQAVKLHDQTRRRAWEEIKAYCRIVGKYRNIYQNDYYARRSPEASDILAMMNENMERVWLARQTFDNGNYSDTLRILAKVVW